MKFTEFQLKWLKRVLFVLLIASCYFVVYAAWTDLNNPGTQIAKDYQGYAEITLFLMIIIAVPLWSIKLERIKAWEASMQDIKDPVLRNKMWWLSLKPIVYQLIFVGIMAVIAYFVINTYFHIPQAVVDNYTQYYNPPNLADINISNISYTEFPHTDIPEFPDQTGVP